VRASTPYDVHIVNACNRQASACARRSRMRQGQCEAGAYKRIQHGEAVIVHAMWAPACVQAAEQNAERIVCEARRFQLCTSLYGDTQAVSASMLYSTCAFSRRRKLATAPRNMGSLM